MIKELEAAVGPNEKILYEGKPNKKCYIFESIFNPLLPFALLWGIIDSVLIGSAFSSENKTLLSFVIPFMLLHMMPVWMYLGGIILTVKRYKNTAYIVTDRAIYVSSGVLEQNIATKPFAELSHINLHRGVFDRMFDVGDIIASSSHTINGVSVAISISSISNYIDIYNLVKKLQTDIYTDVMYPNDKRPAENHGYNTQYKG